MDDLENKMGQILSNPDLMQKIMAMAQSLNGPSEPKQAGAPPKQEIATPAAQETAAPLFPDLDLSMVQKLSGFAKGASIDKNQQGLLRALGPYLSRDRIGKLEKAMRAAKIASVASSFLGQSGLMNMGGR